ncbi:MAG: aldo/keto reductase [Planctomycetes bacterium]|nr:aldo/keto reductase [Planctomycetota bacterium]
MAMRLLGRTGTLVSELCLGCMTFGKNDWGVGSLGEAEAADLISRSIERGVNFFDTADVYSRGESEVLLGRALRGRRDQAVIATKVRGAMSEDQNDVGLSRRHVLASCEASLKRLGTDRIDLYQVHGWDPLTPLEETLEALDLLVRQGKVLYLGASNLAGWQLAKALELQKANGWARFVTLQPYYSLVGREIEFELVPLCEAEGVGLLPWSPLAGGYLSAKYRHGGEGRRSGERQFPPVDKVRGEKVLDVLEDVARGLNTTPARAALAWVLKRSMVTSVIIGARSREQLDDNLAAAELALGDDAMRRLDEVSALPLPYPQWMIAFQGQNRPRPAR